MMITTKKLPATILTLTIGAMFGVMLTLSCSDDSPQKADAATCNCAASEPPLAGRFVTVTNTASVPANGTGGTDALCPDGAQLISGSCMPDDASSIVNVAITESGFPQLPQAAWFCRWKSSEPSAITFRATAICLKAAP